MPIHKSIQIINVPSELDSDKSEKLVVWPIYRCEKNSYHIIYSFVKKNYLK